MDKKFILFDLDGTLTDPKIGITNSVQYSLETFGIQVADTNDLLPFIGPPLKDSFCKYYSFNEDTADLAIQKYREYFSEKGIFENTLYPGMDTLLRNLKEKGKTLIVATSKPTVFAIRILSHFHIDHYFTFVSGSELDGRRTKKSEVIQYALDQCNITALEKAIMVGDREYDIIGANEVGMDSIGVLYGYGNIQELTEANAAHIVKNVGELSNLLNSME